MGVKRATKCHRVRRMSSAGVSCCQGVGQTNILTSAIYPAYIAIKYKNYFWAATKETFEMGMGQAKL